MQNFDDGVHQGIFYRSTELVKFTSQIEDTMLQSYIVLLKNNCQIHQVVLRHKCNVEKSRRKLTF